MTIQLILPDTTYEASYREYIRELGAETRYPFPLDYPHEDFPALVQRLHDLADGIGVPEGYVASTTYWLVEHGELIGVANLRHVLNERLRQHGGHIGLGIRPSQRGKGMGNALLALVIGRARDKGISDVHIHCLQHNTPSARMIMRNGGVLHSESSLPEAGRIVQRYIIRAAGSA